eukprot:CAMPEP_0180174216 /NCGR_PEP_ID=MMETSP0986-20121125/36019_1 /TAXON_ID=697907 /ORGANISM="non described non described, Strain CCMP2293" /LENGTH=66 /DNA_ID=CAMNT_0022126513 /DNA_START=176 /DNA_END=373 /DNA_ORIENTATION=+
MRHEGDERRAQRVRPELQMVPCRDGKRDARDRHANQRKAHENPLQLPRFVRQPHLMHQHSTDRAKQ